MANRFGQRSSITTHIRLMACKLNIDLGLSRGQLYRKPEQWLRNKYRELKTEHNKINA